MQWVQPGASSVSAPLYEMVACSTIAEIDKIKESHVRNGCHKNFELKQTTLTYDLKKKVSRSVDRHSMAQWLLWSLTLLGTIPKYCVQ